MKKNKQIRLTLLLLAIVVACAVGVFVLRGGGNAPIQQGNLVENGDFSAGKSGWATGAWLTGEGTTYYDTLTLEDGRTAAYIENVAANDARFEQTVSVRENATYKLTANVRAEGCEPGRTGANVSFLGIYGTSESAFDTGDEWQTLTLYGRTGKGQTSITICARLGGYGSEETGKAWFTDVTLEQVSEAPVGVNVLELSTPEPQKEKKPEADDRSMVIPGMLGVGGVYMLLCVLLALTLLRPGAGGKRRGWPVVLILAAALAVRLVIAGSVRGYGVDMGCFAAWGGRMASVGPANFYQEGYFCDYPPAYMLVLGAIAKLAGLLNVSLTELHGEMLMKSVPILCDIALAGMAYAISRKRMGERAALALCLLAAFNPAFIVTGSAWGQIDSVLAALLVVMLMLAKEENWAATIPVFALAVLAKPQAGLLVPLGIFALLRSVVTNKKARGSAALGLLFGAGMTALVALPFSKGQEPLWLVNKYVETLSSYAYATLSTGNLMFLLGGNWKPLDTALIGGVTYGHIGTVLMILSFALGIAVYFTGKRTDRLYTASALTLQALFVLGSKMHERYILPALVLLLLAYAETGDLRLLASGVIASAATAVNVGVVLAFDYLISPNLWLGYVLGGCQMLALALTLWAAIALGFGGAPMRLPEVDSDDTEERDMREAQDGRMRRALLEERKPILRLRIWDVAIMLLITAAYSVVAFVNLGTDKAPQTGYVSAADGDQVIIDLGQMRQSFHIYYYGGISDTQFSFETSMDGENWNKPVDAYFGRGTCFMWQAMRQPTYKGDVVSGASGDMLNFAGRYIRVTFDGPGSALWEVAAVDEAGKVIPAVSAKRVGPESEHEDDPMALIDEQDTVPDVPSYLNSMYFDEIYHARTGYEHANGLSTYEWTHPPLGKVFMSWSIKALGMTPFAWRLPGVITGIAMLPMMYLLAMLLLGRTSLASLCMLLFAADCMHFTQTRIATVDSFPVLFIMAMFFFMGIWMRMNFHRDSLIKTLVPLALSGVFMGLACASKWIGCYGAAGLAVLFFGRLIVLARQSAWAARHRSEDAAFDGVAWGFMPKAAITCACCVLFFVVIPLLIYILSYVPYMEYYGGFRWNKATLERIWQLQISMFSYHNDLNATHYFASPWYEWPVIGKPMWYYSASFKPAGMASSILAFGNPAVWWTGLAAILLALGAFAVRGGSLALGLRKDERTENAGLAVLAVGFLSALLPWVPVPRLTFIYHYFASVPFIILATGWCFGWLMERGRKKTAWALMILLAVAAVALFAAFYPLASGMIVPRSWCDKLNWFDGWMWY